MTWFVIHINFRDYGVVLKFLNGFSTKKGCTEVIHFFYSFFFFIWGRNNNGRSAIDLLLGFLGHILSSDFTDSAIIFLGQLISKCLEFVSLWIVFILGFPHNIFAQTFTKKEKRKRRRVPQMFIL